MLAVEAKAGGNIQAVHRLLAIVALGRRDVDGGGEEDGDIHRDDGSRPTGQEEGDLVTVKSSTQNQMRSKPTGQIPGLQPSL